MAISVRVQCHGGSFPDILVLTIIVCVLPFHLFWTSGLWDVPARVTQEEGRTGFLHLPSAVLALIFLARRIQPSVPFPRRPSSRILCTNELIVLHLLLFFCGEKCDYTGIRTHVPTSEGFEVTN